MPRITERKLEDLFGELVQAVQIDDSVARWIQRGLLESHKDEKKYHDSCVEALHRQYRLIQGRLDKMYVDKLDGKVDEGFCVVAGIKMDIVAGIKLDTSVGMWSLGEG